MVVHCICLCSCKGSLEFCVGTNIKRSNFINYARSIDFFELDRVVDIVNYFGRGLMWHTFSLLQCSLKAKWNPSERRPGIKSTRTENTSILSVVLAPWKVLCVWLFLSVDQLTSYTTSPHSVPQISSPMWQFILTKRKLNLTRVTIVIRTVALSSDWGHVLIGREEGVGKTRLKWQPRDRSVTLRWWLSHFDRHGCWPSRVLPRPREEGVCVETQRKGGAAPCSFIIQDRCFA